MIAHLLNTTATRKVLGLQPDEPATGYVQRTTAANGDTIAVRLVPGPPREATTGVGEWGQADAALYCAPDTTWDREEVWTVGGNDYEVLGAINDSSSAYLKVLARRRMYGDH